MTCYWDALLNKISLSTINEYLGPKDCSYIIIDRVKFITLLKENAIQTIDVLWNGEQLSKKMIEENIIWIKQYNIDKINQGHDTSVCDPFLILICELFLVDIVHNYNGTIITYTNNCNISKRILRFESNNDHFW